MQILIAMALVAALFVMFTLFRPRRKCSGNCGACHGSCELEHEGREETDVD
jgi:mono/diheme cytochrome c family protein